VCVCVCVCVVYYLNHIQKTTQWDRPMPAAPAPVFVADHGARVASAIPAAAAGLMDGGIVKTFVQTYNKEMISRYGGGRADIDSAKGNHLSHIIFIVIIIVVIILLYIQIIVIIIIIIIIYNVCVCVCGWVCVCVCV
jgi:hypothetical protein